MLNDPFYDFARRTATWAAWAAAQMTVAFLISLVATPFMALLPARDQLALGIASLGAQFAELYWLLFPGVILWSLVIGSAIVLIALRQGRPSGANVRTDDRSKRGAFPEEGLAVAVLMNTNGNEGELTSIAGQLAPP